MNSAHLPAVDASQVSPDAELVRQYRAGREAAATELVQRHGAALARHLFASGADRGDIEDLVQEALFRAFQRISQWRGGSFRAWLCVIAGNVMRDEGRRRARRRVLPLGEHDAAAPDNPATELAMRDAEDRLRAAIGALTHLQRQVFLLRIQQGMEYSSIATQLGTTMGAARVHYHMAVRRLKEAVT